MSQQQTTLPLVEGFDAFYRREYSRMVALAYALLGSGVAAEDVVQEAFLAAHRRWSKIAGYDDPRGWVRRVVVNRATSVLRRRTAEWRAVHRLGSRDAWSTVPALEPGAREVWDEVRALPRRQAQAIALYYVDDLSLDEIGGVLGCSPGTVKTHLHRARQQLERKLASWNEEAG